VRTQGGLSVDGLLELQRRLSEDGTDGPVQCAVSKLPDAACAGRTLAGVEARAVGGDSLWRSAVPVSDCLLLQPSGAISHADAGSTDGDSGMPGDRVFLAG